MRPHITASLDSGTNVNPLPDRPEHQNQVGIWSKGGSLTFFVDDPDIAEELAERLLESVHALRARQVDAERPAS